MSFQQGLSGLNIASKNLDVIGNNVANSSTVGFKQSQAQFADVFAASLTGSGSSPVGLGSKVALVSQQFTQGNVTSTNNPLDVAINGGGFFRISSAGIISYARNGQFQLDNSGYIVTSGGGRVTGYPASSAGLINTGALADIQIPNADIAPQATGTNPTGAKGVSAQINLDSRASLPVTAPFDYTNPQSYNNSTALTIYDSLGSPATYTTYYVKTGVNTWNVYSSVANSAGVSSDLSAGGTVPLTTLNFDTSGNLVGFLPATQAIPAAALGTGAAALSFPVEYAGTTQYGGSFGVNALAQDGFTLGRLAGFNIGKDGIIVGRYTNGQTKNLGQLVLVSFRNPQGLQPLGNNLWTETSSSGVALLGEPGSSGAYGSLQSAAVEDSNVDLTAELVNMITSQRIYQANAQSIKTQDAILQTLVNLR